MNALIRAWRARWGFLRLAVAVTLFVMLVVDRPAQLARAGLAAIEDADVVAMARELRLAGRFGDAVMVADAGMTWANDETKAKLTEERRLASEEQASWLRRAKDVGMGALTGRGDSLERLIGAVGSDLFLVGDLRDLTVEAFKQTTTGDSDEIVVLLSTAGVVTSVAPAVDWAPAVMKAAKKAGAIGERLESALRTALREGRWTEAKRILDPAGQLARATSPATALKVMPVAASADDLAKLAKFAESGADAKLAMQVGGREVGMLLLRGGDGAEAAAKAAARKGAKGYDFLAGAGRAALRPHPILGLLKSGWKGNLSALATRAVERAGPLGWWLIPAIGVWAGFEALWLVGRIRSPRPQ